MKKVYPILLIAIFLSVSPLALAEIRNTGASDSTVIPDINIIKKDTLVNLVEPAQVTAKKVKTTTPQEPVSQCATLVKECYTCLLYTSPSPRD